MFAGLPGIRVGTLFYVLLALWMPFRELPRVVRGTSSLARWRVIVRQSSFAMGIIAAVAAAERLVLWMLGEAPRASHPAALLHDELGAMADASPILAAPIAASLLLLAGVLLAVQLARLVACVGRWARSGSRREAETGTGGRFAQAP